MISAAIASALIGLFWAVAYRVAPQSATLWVAAHGVGGLLLGAAVERLPGRLRPARPGAAAAVAALLAGVVAPAAMALAGPAEDVGAPIRLAALAGAAAVAAAFGLAAMRLGAVAAALAATGAIAGLVAASRPEAAVLPGRAALRAPVAPGGARHVAVIGMDGADWSVLDPMLAAGEMPNLRGLIERGASAVLTSIEPTYSPVVWASIFSGKRPEKHGLLGWYTSHAANREASMLWEIAGAAGLTSIVVNVPGTWPPSELRGAMVSGFPIPGVVEATEAAESQYLGNVVSTSARDGLVPTFHARRTDGAPDAVADVALGEAPVRSRARIRHPLLEGLIRRRLLHTAEASVRVEVPVDPAAGAGAYRIDGSPVHFTDNWSPWIERTVFGTPVALRARVLPDGGLYLTPPFQRTPLGPHRFTSSAAAEAAVEGEPYVVEGAGWRCADDPDLRLPLFEHLERLGDRRTRALLGLLHEVDDWSLLAHIMIITDRVSHAFWRLHEPDAYGPRRPEDEGAPDLVRRGYQVADQHLGRILAALPEDTVVLVVSDHGFRAEPETGHGNHRLDGMLVAAGSGIRPTRERLKLSVLDVTPTVLALLGLPAAQDMDGAPAAALLATPQSPRSVATYEPSGTGGGAARVTISESTEEQLRSLGYVE